MTVFGRDGSLIEFREVRGAHGTHVERTDEAKEQVTSAQVDGSKKEETSRATLRL